MKESISYSFLLNIIILFVFTSFAVVMGILSYYKAFKANTIITETIEKYEGYNCVSAEEIARKLGTIGYNTPFNVTCNGKGDNCMTDENQSYAVISYNLDLPKSDILTYDDTYKKTMYKSEEKYKNMNSSYKCDSNGCMTNKHYQYGVYTYMYVEAPAISNLIRIPLFAKTDVMYEFRNFYVNKINIDEEEFDQTTKTWKKTGKTQEVKQITEVESIFDSLYLKKKINGNLYVNDAFSGDASAILADVVLDTYTKLSTGGNSSYEYLFGKLTGEGNINYRTRIMIELLSGNEPSSQMYDATLASGIKSNGKDGYWRRVCGYVPDYKKINP